MDAQQIDVLRHSLGIGADGLGREYRNHFCAGPGHSDYEACEDLVTRGMMTRREGSAITGGDAVFYVTDAGREAARGIPPKLTRDQKRYQRFLDADSGMTFREWIKRGNWK